MGIFDGKKTKLEIERLQAENAELKSNNDKLSSENKELIDLIEKTGGKDVIDISKRIGVLNAEIMRLEDDITGKNKEIEGLNAQSTKLNTDISMKQKQVVTLEDEILVQSFGLYKPRYEFETAEKYRAELEKVRAQQKEMLKDGSAVTGAVNWAVNGNAKQGAKMIADIQKLLLRAFNSECDDTIAHVKYSNFDQSLKRITSSRIAISKLGSMMSVSIQQCYYDAKIDELHIALEYQQKKQQEKEDQRAAREEMREQAKLQKEIEAERRRLEKEKTHYENALTKIRAQIAAAPENERPALQEKLRELEDKNAEIDKAIADVDYRQANQRSGYVYVISNIGAFGENIYKIGMTRRLDPTERIDELSGASVPFNFDIHAMIFCDDAPALETALHKAFEDKKLNYINTRREFFNVTLDDIKAVVLKNYDKTIEFIDVAQAEQYRASRKMRDEMAAR